MNQKGFIPILVALLIAAAVGAYFLYQQQTKTTSPSPLSTETSVKEADETANWKTYKHSKIDGLDFSGYEISYPSSWSQSVPLDNRVNQYHKLVLSNGSYSIEIYQAGFGGAVCLFDGDENFEGPLSDHRGKQFVEIISSFGLLRRVQDSSDEKGLVPYKFCQRRTESSYFSTTTDVGAVSYSVPKDYDKVILSEMDSILKTIEILN